MAVNLMMQNYLYGRYRWPWISELYEYIQSVYLLPAVVSVMLNPRKPTFKVTAKNESLDKSYISELGRPFYIIFALLALAVGVTLWKVVTQPYQADVTLVVGRLERAQPDHRRAAPSASSPSARATARASASTSSAGARSRSRARAFRR